MRRKTFARASPLRICDDLMIMEALADVDIKKAINRGYFQGPHGLDCDASFTMGSGRKGEGIRVDPR